MNAQNPKLFLLLLGCKPEGRLIEQHDVFFGIGTSLKSLVPQIKAFWPEAKGKIHIDAWREITAVDGWEIQVIPKSEASGKGPKLFFLNLGGYKPGEFEEYHYRLLGVAENLSQAVKKARATTFYRHHRFKGAVSHIDEQYGIDLDDAYEIEEILNPQDKSLYSLRITDRLGIAQDQIHLGYLKLGKV